MKARRKIPKIEETEKLGRERKSEEGERESTPPQDLRILLKHIHGWIELVTF